MVGLVGDVAVLQGAELEQVLRGSYSRFEPQLMRLRTAGRRWLLTLLPSLPPGQGFGCHLHGLQQLALARGQPLPGLYADPAYSNINHIVLSSSTLSSSVLRTGGAAPVVPDGLGLGYGFREDGTRSIVTGYPAVNVCDFQECVFKSLKDIYAVLEGKPIS